MKPYIGMIFNYGYQGWSAKITKIKDSTVYFGYGSEHEGFIRKGLCPIDRAISFLNSGIWKPIVNEVTLPTLEIIDRTCQHELKYYYGLHSFVQYQYCAKCGERMTKGIEYKNPNIFTALDLEHNQPSEKIIQIGAVIGNVDTGEILEELNIIIDPKEPISEFITKLTGVTNKAVDLSGILLLDGYKQLRDLHKKHGANVNPITWGGGDSKALLDQLTAPTKVSCGSLELRYNRNIQLQWPFGRRWIDAKTLYQSYCLANGIKMQSGLKKSCHKLGITFEGPAHNALQDAKMTFKIYRELVLRYKK